MLKMQQDLNKTFMAILALPATALGFALSVQIVALTWILSTRYNLDIHDIGLVWAAGPIAGIFGQVLIGIWSDKVWLWSGRRRPFILVGGTIAALMLLALPNIGVISSALGFEGVLGVALVVVLSLDFAINVGFNPTRSIIADVTPEGIDRTRGYTWMQTVSGSFGVAASLIGAYFGNLTLIYTGAVLVLLFSIIPPFLIEEPEELTDEEDAAPPKKNSLKSMLMAIQPLWGFLVYDIYAMTLRLAGVERNDYYAEIACAVVTIVLVTRTLLARESSESSDADHLTGFRQVIAAHSFSWIGVQSMFVFFFVFLESLTTELGAENLQYVNGNAMAILQAVGAALPVLLLIPLADRIGRVKTHTLTLVFMTAGYTAMYFLGHSATAIFVFMAIIGIGWASIVSLPFAIFSQKIAKEEMGLYMGLFNLSVVLPQLVVSLGISLVVARADNPNIIFAIAAISLAMSALAWTRVREN
jgi:MFS family permease